MWPPSLLVSVAEAVELQARVRLRRSARPLHLAPEHPQPAGTQAAGTTRLCAAEILGRTRRADGGGSLARASDSLNAAAVSYCLAAALQSEDCARTACHRRAPSSHRLLRRMCDGCARCCAPLALRSEGRVGPPQSPARVVSAHTAPVPGVRPALAPPLPHASRAAAACVRPSSRLRCRRRRAS